MTQKEGGQGDLRKRETGNRGGGREQRGNSGTNIVFSVQLLTVVVQPGPSFSLPSPPTAITTLTGIGGREGGWSRENVCWKGVLTEFRIVRRIRDLH